MTPAVEDLKFAACVICVGIVMLAGNAQAQTNRYDALTNTFPPNFGTLFVTLAPWSERVKHDLPIEAIFAHVRPRFAKILGARVLALNPTPIRGLSHVDLVMRVDDGPEHRVEDLPVASSSPEVIVAQAMPAMRALKTADIRVRLLGRGPEGERVLGEYTFAHTPS